jgi:molybdenum cofactor synthesis domain-containing protein
MSGPMAVRQRGEVVSVNVSSVTGERKMPASRVELVAGHGVAGDAHAGPGQRQLSLLALESFEHMPAETRPLVPGDFAENVTTRGIDLLALPVGTRVRVGRDALIEISQHGKRCHAGCEISQRVGTCVMPREGVFATVVCGGVIEPGDAIEPVADPGPPARDTFAVLTCSDSCFAGQARDTAGPALVELGQLAGWECLGSELVADDRAAISAALVGLADRGASIIFTTGGTGLGPRDVTPEATLDVAERLAPGIAEAIRSGSARFTPRAMLSRGVAVLRSETLIINLPGSETAVRESFGIVAEVLPHALRMIRGEGHCKRE